MTSASAGVLALETLSDDSLLILSKVIWVDQELLPDPQLTLVVVGTFDDVLSSELVVSE